MGGREFAVEVGMTLGEMNHDPIALISDVHSNLEALTAVLEEIDRRGVAQIYCLGDIVGYGPDPGAVIEIVRGRCTMALRGNHDEAIFRGAEDFNPIARQALEANREMIRPGFLKPGARKVWWGYLRDLKTSEQRGDVLFVHGSPRDPIREYVMKTDVMFSPRKMEEIYENMPKLGFGGHTHQPGVFVQGVGHHSPEELDGVYHFSDAKAFLNTGSVGQPRDSNPRSCFGVLHPDRFEWVRVDYDVETTVEKIYRNPRIDNLCADRLRLGR